MPPPQGMNSSVVDEYDVFDGGSERRYSGAAKHD
jgi:hypothetical protein